MILINDLASFIESLYTEEELSYDVRKSKIVNPRNDAYNGKTIIINYLYDCIDLDRLAKYNTIISRVPLPLESDRYELVPYDLEKSIDLSRINVIDVPKVLTPYSFNKELTNIDIIDIPRSSIFTKLHDNGYINIAGFVVNKLDLIGNTYKDLYRFINLVKPHFSSIITNKSDNVRLSKFKQFEYLESPTIDLTSDNCCFIGPSVVIRSPNKRMNVKQGYIVNKFKTYRITDNYRSYNIRFNTTDGFYLFEPINKDLNSNCFNWLESIGGFDTCLYFLFYFCKKNHFNCITGDIFTEPFQVLVDTKKEKTTALNITLYPPKELIYNPDIFNLSIFGNNKLNPKLRDYLTF